MDSHSTESGLGLAPKLTAKPWMPAFWEPPHRCRLCCEECVGVKGKPTCTHKALIIIFNKPLAIIPNNVEGQDDMCCQLTVTLDRG